MPEEKNGWQVSRFSALLLRTFLIRNIDSFYSSNIFFGVLWRHGLGPEPSTR